MNENKPWHRSFWRVLLLTLTATYSFWYMATPRVSVYYSGEGAGPLSFVWDTYNGVYKGKITPGGATGDTGDIFPNERFFMDFHWTASRKNNCIRINPKWPETNIYIGADGKIDMSEGSGTDVDRLHKCS